MNQHREIIVEPDQIDPERPHLLAIEATADPKIAQAVIDAAVCDVGDGRSEWKWFRLANGDLILGCWPQGDTYEMTEMDENRP